MSKVRPLFYVFLLALSVRLLYLCQVGQSPFFFPSPGLDPFLYHQWAKSIAEGKGMGEGVFQAMPLYPYFLGLIYTFTAGSFFWAILVQLFLGALSVLFVYSIGKSLFGPGVGWIASLGLALSGTSFFYEALLVPASLISFLFITTFFLLLRAARGNRLRDWVWLGCCLALTTLANAGILLFLPFLFIWMIVSLPGSLLRKCLTFGMLLVFVGFAILAVSLRNGMAAQDPVFPTAHSGINFYIGNHSGATGRFQSLFARHTSSEQLLQESKKVAEAEIGRTLKASEVSRFWFQKGFDFIRKQPGQYLRLLSKKILLFWNGYEIPDVKDYYFFRSQFPILKYLGIPFAWIAPLGLLGICVSLRHFRSRFLLYGFLFSQMIGILLIFVNSRYRAPLVFLVVLFAAYGVSWLCHLFREKRYRKIFVTSVFLLHLVLLTHVNMGSTDEELQHYNVGIALGLAGKHDAAIEALQKALFIYPEDSVILFALANAHFRKGDFPEARRLYEEVLSHDPHHSDAYFNLGLLAFYQEHWDEAEEHFRKSASLEEDRADVFYFLSAVYREKGLHQEAHLAKERARALGADPAMLEREPDLSLFAR